MKIIMNLLLVSMLLITLGNLNVTASAGESYATVSERAVKTMAIAVTVFDNVIENAGNGIPQELINSSEGIIILPAACRVAAGAYNERGGRGIAMIRNENGSWSNPFFVTSREGSLGYKTGTHASDIVLLFKDRNDIMDIEKAEITLGDDLEIKAGPGNKGNSSNTGYTFGTEIYSYHRLKGVFAGVNLKGGILSHYTKLSNSFYGVENINMDDLFHGMEIHYHEVKAQTENLTTFSE